MAANSIAKRRGILVGFLSVGLFAFVFSTSGVQTAITNLLLKRTSHIAGLKFATESVSYSFFPLAVQISGLEAYAEGERIVRLESFYGCLAGVNFRNSQYNLSKFQASGIQISATRAFNDSLVLFLRQTSTPAKSSPWNLKIQRGWLKDIQIEGVFQDSTAYLTGNVLEFDSVHISDGTSKGNAQAMHWLFQPANALNAFTEPLRSDSIAASWDAGVSEQFNLMAVTNLGFLKASFDESEAFTQSSIEFVPDTSAWPLDASATWVQHLKSLAGRQSFNGSAEIDSIGHLQGQLKMGNTTVIPFEWNRAGWSTGPFSVNGQEVEWAPLKPIISNLTWLHQNLDWLVEINGSTEGLECQFRPVQNSPERIQITWKPSEEEHEVQLNFREISMDQVDLSRPPNRISAEAQLTVTMDSASGQLRFLESSKSMASGDVRIDWDSTRWAYQTDWTLNGVHAFADESAWELFAGLKIRGSGNWSGDWKHIAESRNIRLMENSAPRAFERIDLIHEKTGPNWRLNWYSDLSNGNFQANSEALQRWGLLGTARAQADSSTHPFAQMEATLPGFNTIALLLGIPVETKGITSIRAHWMDTNQSIDLEIPSLSWKSLSAEGIGLKASFGSADVDSIQWQVAQVQYNESARCYQFEGSLAGNKSLNGQASWIAPDQNQKGKLCMDIAIDRPLWTLRLDSLFFPIGPDRLTLNEPTYLMWNTQKGDFRLNGLHVSNAEGNWASASGVLSPSGELEANLNFQWNALPNALASLDSTLQVTNTMGDVTIYGNYDAPEFAANLQLGEWKWQGLEGQNSQCISYGLLEKPHLIFSTELPPNGTMRIEADLPINNPASWSAEVRLNQFALNNINRWLPDQSIEVLGAADALVWIEDFRGVPKIRGNLTTFGTQLAVPYLGMVYDLEGRVDIEPGAFYMDQWRIRDDLGSEALFNGTVLHEDFQQWDLDFGIDATKQKLRLMDIPPVEDAYFFGEAMCTGDINISGYGRKLSIDASLNAVDGTQFSLPLDGTSDVSYADFIRFTGGNEAAEERPKPASAFSDISLNLGIDVDPDAEARIIFNRDVGDEIVGHAQGHLDLSIDDFERIRLNGALEIVDGIYYFTLQNWLSKRFDIEPGGTLIWEGDPYRANVDLSTVYSTRARLNPLFPDITDLPGRVPVDLKLGMTGPLMRPDVAFDIVVPNADSRVQALMEDALINEEEKQRQALSLLVMNQFFSIDPMASSIGGFLNTGQSTQLIANQLGHWISQISPGIDVGLDYEQDVLSGEQALGVALSTQLLNDRLHIEGAVGMQTVGAIETSDMQLQDLTISFDLIPDGTLQLTGHSRQNQALSNSLEGNQTQGVGLRFKRDFDFWKDWKSKTN